MEDATITQEVTSEMYQQGRYPSIIDTDDIVFEVGKLWIWNLNKERLLDNLLQKSKLLEALAIDAKKAFLVAEEKQRALQDSNEKYVKNNQRLDAELVNIRQENRDLKVQINNLKVIEGQSSATNS